MRYPFALCICLIAGATVAEARSFRPAQLPRAPDSCNTCHTNGGGSPRNAFGQDVENNLTAPLASAPVNWSAVCTLDSDSDGFTNGVELGDPDCTWTIGDGPVRTRNGLPFAPTAPADAGSSPVCGNSLVEGLETCDDGNQVSGDGCSATCLTECGNGTLEGPETCDDGNLSSGDGCSILCRVETVNDPDGDGNDDGGCYAVAPGSWWPLMLLVGLGSRMRPRRRRQRD